MKIFKGTCSQKSNIKFETESQVRKLLTESQRQEPGKTGRALSQGKPVAQIPLAVIKKRKWKICPDKEKKE